MKHKPRKFRGKVQGGKLFLDNETSFRSFLKLLSGPVEIIVRRVRAKRSLDQNAYYWHVLTVIGDHVGHSKEELHDHFKSEFLSRPVMLANQETGCVYELKRGVPSSATMYKGDFSEYLQKVIQVGIDLGIRIRTPEEYYAEF